jgi:SPP1 family predicted phage head-tail adaptor
MKASCKVNAGNFNKRLEIQSVIQAADGQGGYTDTWTSTAKVWGSIEPVKGYEKFQAMQLETQITHRIHIRFRTGITTKHRIVYDKRVFDIKEVINLDEDNLFLRLMAVEVA